MSKIIHLSPKPREIPATLSTIQRHNLRPIRQFPPPAIFLILRPSKSRLLSTPSSAKRYFVLELGGKWRDEISPGTCFKKKWAAMLGPHFDYRIRVSARAKYMSLRVTVERGLEVVVPRGFNQVLIPAFLREKREWVQSALAKIQQVRDLRSTEANKPLRPTEIRFSSINKSWQVQYEPKRGRKLTLVDNGKNELQLIGAVDSISACYTVLRRWTHRQAHCVLIPLLKELSRETGIAFAKTAIRCQKSRWGSCSTSGTISLNQKLLFIEPDLVRYVLIHELCHMREMNHSRHFWRLVGQFYPDYKQARRRLRDAWFQMPTWAG